MIVFLGYEKLVCDATVQTDEECLHVRTPMQYIGLRIESAGPHTIKFPITLVIQSYFVNYQGTDNR